MTFFERRNYYSTTDQIESMTRQRDTLRAALRAAEDGLNQIAACAGAPDPREGCRLVAAVAAETLKKIKDQRGVYTK